MEAARAYTAKSTYTPCYDMYMCVPMCMHMYMYICTLYLYQLGEARQVDVLQSRHGQKLIAMREANASRNRLVRLLNQIRELLVVAVVGALLPEAELGQVREGLDRKPRAHVLVIANYRLGLVQHVGELYL